jgi:hypothetical protein
MTRAILLASLLLGACTVGEVNTNSGGNNNGTVDAPGGSNGGNIDAPGSGSDVAKCVDRATPGTKHIHAGTGTDHAGESCLAAGCHLNGNVGNGAPPFQFAGTIYKKGTTTPDPGAVIMVKPDSAAIAPIQLVADTGGNFNIGVTQGSMPASTMATACPDLMLGHQTAKLNGNTTPGKGGDCNGCHGLTQAAMSTN